MEYLDEKIVELRRQQKRENNQDINGEYIFIENENIKFVIYELFDHSISVMLPENYVDMPLEVAQIKYPSEQRPQIIKTSEDGSINFCFNYFHTNFLKEQVSDTILGLQAMLKKLQPSNLFFDFGTEVVNNNEIGWFDTKGYALDDQIYSMIFVLSVRKRMCMGAINCPFRRSTEWIPIMKQVIRSIHEIKQKEL